MASKLSQRKGRTGTNKTPSRSPLARENGFPSSAVHILDADLASSLIRERQERGIDLYDEVWDGVYVMPPLANLPHQNIVMGLTALLHQVVNQEGRGQVYPGANVSDRRVDWQVNFRVPDVVVVLNNSRAVDCNTHLWGGPDFLVEIQSPGDDTEAKIPFYSQIQVQELLIVQRDTRQLVLHHHGGRQLVPVPLAGFQGGKWLLSRVLPLAFRRLGRRAGPQIEVQRTDQIPGHWVI